MTLCDIAVKMLQELGPDGLKAEHDAMVRRGEIERVETPLGTLELMCHPLLRREAHYAT